MELPNLKTQRKSLRISFTACANKIEEELRNENPDIKILSILESQLKGKFSRLEECQKEITGIILQAANAEKEYEADFLAAEEYSDKYFELCCQIDQELMRVPLPTEAAEKRKFKLPKIELKKFSGEAKDYLAFWSQFSKIHEDKSIPDEDKFMYLLQAVVPGSKAARVVESFPATAANYSKAIDQVKERFGREDLLVQIYVRDLLSMVMKNASAGRIKTDLPRLYDELETKIRALESLGRTQEKYGDFLTPLVESCLPEDILIAWERNRNSKETAQAEDRSLEKLMNFLKQEVHGEEMVILARSGFGASNIKKKEFSNRNFESPTAAALVSMNYDNESRNPNAGKKIISCIFCQKNHPSKDCFTARTMSLESKKKILMNKNACFSCFRYGHSYRSCKIKNLCIYCNQRNHHYLLCPNRKENGNETFKAVSEIETSTLTSQCEDQNVYLMTLIVKVHSKFKQINVRAIIDSGAENCYLSEKIAKELNLKPKRKIKMKHSLFGGRETNFEDHYVYDLTLSALDNSHSFQIEVFSTPQICRSLPKVNDSTLLNELKERGVELSDCLSSEKEINLLIGINMIAKFFTDRFIRLDCGLFIVETYLGHVLSGKKITSKINDPLILSDISMHIGNLSVRDLWYLESLGITDPIEEKRKAIKSDTILEEFKSNMKILPSGRYQVQLPFKSESKILPTNKELTWKRHQKMCQRAENKLFLDEYKAVFQEWEKLSIIEKVKGDLEIGHFLPHHPVIKNESITTKIRPVFDASARQSGKCSLNDLLYKGPNLIELIPDIIDRFRSYPIGLSSDIERAFLQLEIDPAHRDYLRFFYPVENEQLVYRHCRVVFGVTSSPFLLAASISCLLDQVPVEYENLAQKLKHAFYVDNCVSGVSSTKEQENFIIQTQEILLKGCFNLRNWESNVACRLVSKSTGITKVLGVLWNLDDDTLKCNLSLEKITNDQEFTKRLILSAIQKVFDPIGLLSPATLPPKLLLQDTWKLKLGWDTMLPENTQRIFKKWFSEMSILGDIEIPRYVEINDSTVMHVFVDACKAAYAACVFFRSETSRGIKIQFIRAKSRVAPLKQMTIPRLELMACCIGARLANSVQQALNIQEVKTVFWSDSMVALYWLKERGDWSIFVANRVTEINKIQPNGEWRHVPGNMNPADLLSRGCTPKQLLESQWWEGPSWLKESKENWPVTELNIPETPESLAERKRVTMCNINISEENSGAWYAKRFSNFNSIIRLVAWILRFVNNCRTRFSSRKKGELSIQEIENAETLLIRTVQFEYWKDIGTIPHLCTFKDEKGVIRVKTRITERIDKPTFISPILLPDKGVFTQKVVEHYHQKNCHAGTQILVSILREKYWIYKGRRTVRSIVNNCIKCKRFKAKSLSTDPVSLPADRVGNAAAFEVTGIDLAGPLYIKGGDKTWVVLFTCALYRAVHLETVTSLSTDAFLLSFRRFIARRGRPRVIYSDNGSNFRGCDNGMADIDWEKVNREAQIQRISWKFIPPTAAWWGGWWERLVRIMKELLRRSLGKAVLTYEELITMMCDCESVVNSRPLTYLSEDMQDLTPLTPAMFLKENYNSSVADVDFIDANHLRKRIRFRNKLMQDLRARFRKEYLGQLIQRQQQNPQSPTIQQGDIVLIGEDNKKRLNWPLAKVIELIPGKDGKVRTVKIKTQSNVLIRPLQRIFPLELRETDVPAQCPAKDLPLTQKSLDRIDPSNTLKTVKPIVTRFGRTVRQPVKLTYYN